MHPNNTTFPLRRPQSCPVCGREFYAYACQNKTYCSQLCGYKGRRMRCLDHFWDRVDKSGDCWLWTGNRFPAGLGYGRFIRWPAHRIAYELTHGSIPDGLCVLHSCDNPPCVRPDHLFLGTITDNNADRDAKGRLARGDDHWTRLYPERVLRGDQHPKRRRPETAARGEQHGCAKLTATAVRQIRRDYASGSFRLQDLAERYGVGISAIHSVVRLLTWRHID